MFPEIAQRTSSSVGSRVLFEQRDCHEHHPRRAEAALQPVLLLERGLDRVHTVGAFQPFDGGDRAAVGLHREHVQDFTGVPSSRTVHAPQLVVSQPMCVPVSAAFVRTKSTTASARSQRLASIALSEENVHITNIVYWRPPGNRTPTPQEAQVCRPFLERQVELVAPDVVVLLGGAAAKHIFDVPEGIMRVRGKIRDVTIGSRTVRALATLHPAYLLRTPAAKRLAWRDLLTVKAALAG